MTIGKRLKALRGKRTKTSVANALGVTRSSYVKYERDERVPRDEVKKRIASFYDTSVESIFFANESTKVD